MRENALRNEKRTVSTLPTAQVVGKVDSEGAFTPSASSPFRTRCVYSYTRVLSHDIVPADHSVLS